MKFNSQICTTKEQSERLLALGLKKETADCVIMYYDGWHVGEAEHFDFDKDPVEPAWSLHRLIEMCNNTQVGMTIGIYHDEVTVDGDLFEVFDNTYDNLISIIEWLIKGGHFNKEYLDEQLCVNIADMKNIHNKEDVLEKLRKIEKQQNILRDAIKNGESLSKVAKKHNINLAKLGD